MPSDRSYCDGRFQNQDQQYPVVDLTDQTIVTDAIAPEFAKFRTHQWLAKLTRRFGKCYSLDQKPLNPQLLLSAQTTQAL